MGPLGLSLLTFASITGLVVVIGWAVASSAAIRARLAGEGAAAAPAPDLLRETAPGRFALFHRLAAAASLDRRIVLLAAKAGLPGKAGEVVALTLLLAAAGAVGGLLRTGQILWVLVGGGLGAALPILYLKYRAQKRLEKFAEQFPDALDMMTRALRAGHAIGGSLQVVAEEMPDPVGMEFRQLFRQVSLGHPADQALKELHDRIETEDVRFFHAAVSIQREVGGNLAEILQGLSEVIRERFRILSYARVLSAQHRASAYCVAASPLAMAIAFHLMSPGFFDPLLEAKIGSLLIGAAIVLQVVGFIALKRVATIEV